MTHPMGPALPTRPRWTDNASRLHALAALAVTGSFGVLMSLFSLVVVEYILTAVPGGCPGEHTAVACSPTADAVLVDGPPVATIVLVLLSVGAVVVTTHRPSHLWPSLVWACTAVFGVTWTVLFVNIFSW